MKPKNLNQLTVGALYVALSFMLLCSLPKCSKSNIDKHSLSVEISVSDELEQEFKPDGRLFLFFDKTHEREPRLKGFSGYGYCMFAKNFSDWNTDDKQTIISTTDWDSFQPKSFLLEKDPNNGLAFAEPWNIEDIPNGTYYVQAFWDQNTSRSVFNSPGDIYSDFFEVHINGATKIDISLSKIIPPDTLIEHELLKEINFLSDTLSKWWGKETYLKAAVLLPSGYYKNQGVEYPIRYDIAGFGGSYTRVNNYMQRENFLNYWIFNEKTPQIITVFLNGDGPYGDCYQIDSEYGPYGYALVHELIPYIEEKYRGTQSPETRFVSGCSTGGWASLALQLYYPDYFNGVFSFSPDPVDFNNFMLVNIYEDKNFFINRFGISQPLRRDLNGNVITTMKDLADRERVMSHTGHLNNSRFAFGSFNQLFCPRDSNGQPIPLFDQETGKIDSLVAEHWKKYDLLLYLKENWNELGPKLQGKIYIWMGDMDNFYLNTALRNLDEFLKSTENPKSDAEIVFEPMKGHCEGAHQSKKTQRAIQRVKEINQLKKK